MQSFGAESRQRMSDEGQSAFQLQSKAEQSRERRGTDPCGTPKEMGAGSDVYQWMLTEWVRFVRFSEASALQPS